MIESAFWFPIPILAGAEVKKKGCVPFLFDIFSTEYHNKKPYLKTKLLQHIQ